MALSKKQSDQPGALFIFDTWDKNGYGLSAFHRHLVKTLGKKRSKSLNLYSTVLDIKIAHKHKRDAEKLGVTLIKARQKKRIVARDDPKRIAWLHNFESYYPGILALKNIRYIIGYSPKTGDAAADIRDDAFPSAQLVLINHESPERDCTLYQENAEDLLDRMLELASGADIIFSMGPKLHRYFENKYRAPRSRNRKKLLNIPHKELLPVPADSFFKTDVPVEETTEHFQVLLTYGNLNDCHVVQALADIASLVGSVAKKSHDFHGPIPGWNILGVTNDSIEVVGTLLKEKINSSFVSPKLFQRLNCESLTTNLCQSHVCLPIRCYNEYSFDGLEALAVGVPLLILERSHLADFITKHLPEYIEHSIVRTNEEYQTKMIKILKYNKPAFKVAYEQKKKLKAISTHNDRIFVAMFEDDSAGGDNDGKGSSRKHGKKTSDDHQQMFRHPREQESGCNHSQNQTKHDKQPVDTSTECLHVVHDKSDGGETDESLPENGKSRCDEITVKIKLNEDDFLVIIRVLDSEIEQCSNEEPGHEDQQQDHGLSLLDRKTEVQKVIEQNNKWFRERVRAKLNGDDAKPLKEFLFTHCKDNYAILLHVSEGCLALHLRFSCLQNLCKFTCRCNSGDFTEPLEPFFITDEMRKAAEKAGKPIHLVAVYDDAKLEAVSDFFIARDGGSDVTDDDSSSSGENDDDIEEPEIPFVVKCFTEATTATASPRCEEEIILEAETEEKIYTKNKQLSPQIESDDAEEKANQSKISVMRTQKDKAIEEMIEMECRYKSLLEEDKKRDAILSNVQSEHSSLKMTMDGYISENKCLQTKVNELEDKLKQCKTKIHALESEIGVKSQSESQLRGKLYEAGERIVEEQTREKDSKAEFGEFRQEKYFAKEQLQGLTKEYIIQKNVSLSESEIVSVGQSSEDPHTSTADEVLGTKPKSAKQPVFEDRNVSHINDTKESNTDHTSRSADGNQPGELRTKYLFSAPGFIKNWTIKPAGRPLAINETWAFKYVGEQEPGTKRGLFNNPHGLRWHNDHLLICDTDNNRIQVLNKHLKWVDEIRFDGQFPNAFRPWAVAIYNENYHITDIGNNLIIICDKRYKVIQLIDHSEDILVYGIAILAGNALVTDHKGNSILKYTGDGKHFARCKGGFCDDTKLGYPYSVVAANNRVLVSDANKHNIKVFDSDLNYETSYCSEGVGKGEVRYPLGMDVDACGNIYICDKLNNRIVKLGPNGNFICNLFHGDLENPMHIAVNGTGDAIAVSMFGNIAQPVNQIGVFFEH